MPKDISDKDPKSSAGVKLIQTLDELLAAQLMIGENQAKVNLSLERSEAELFEAVPDVDNQYVQLMPSKCFEFAFQEDTEGDNNNEPVFICKKEYYETRKIAYELGLEENDWIFDDIDIDGTWPMSSCLLTF